MYLFFDTETTGLPKNYKAPVSDIDNWPRVIQLGWQLYSENGELISEAADLVLPCGWEIPNAAYWIRKGFSQEVAAKKGEFWDKYGYSQEDSEANGLPILAVLSKFTDAVQQADYLIAHNMSYDEKVLGAEFFRASKITGKVLKKFCTKEGTTEFCRILPKKYGTYKWPTLTELHQKLFKCDFEGAHDALDDVKATARCFFELRNKSIISI